MKVLTILGTRPEIIRLSRIIPKLDARCDHVLVHTGQNYEHNLSTSFFEQLGVREPDHSLGIKAVSAADQIGQIISRCDEILAKERPDRILILGDTNSGLSAIPAKRRGIPIFHMEAGNRCYDDRVPEEVNRRIIDHTSDYHLPYTEHSRRNLLAEGIASNRIYVSGNPIKEVLDHFDEGIARATSLADVGVKPGRYVLVTLHRAENVDIEVRLKIFIDALQHIAQTTDFPIIVSTHPRTRSRMEAFGITGAERVRFLPPFSFFDFVQLEKSAWCVLSDSGTVGEESCIFRVPTVILRDTTERPEMLECGSNILSGCDKDRIVAAVDAVTSLQNTWMPPPDYIRTNVSDIVVRLLLSYFEPGVRAG